MLMPPHPEWETRDDSLHHDSLGVFAEHLENQIGDVGPPIVDAAQRMTRLADKVRDGLLGVPKALRSATAGGD